MRNVKTIVAIIFGTVVYLIYLVAVIVMIPLMKSATSLNPLVMDMFSDKMNEFSLRYSQFIFDDPDIM